MQALAEISEYPGTAVNHRAAIRCITYAWQSKKENRELIKKIESGVLDLLTFLPPGLLQPN
jgi:hypothetical protein